MIITNLGKFISNRYTNPQANAVKLLRSNFLREQLLAENFSFLQKALSYMFDSVVNMPASESWQLLKISANGRMIIMCPWRDILKKMKEW